MSPWGVQISIIEPGLFKTAMANEERNLEAVQDLWDRLSPETKVEYGEKSLEKCKKLYRRKYSQTVFLSGQWKVISPSLVLVLNNFT